MTMSTSDSVVLRQVTDDLLLVEVAGRQFLVEAACPHRKGRLRYGHVNPRNLRITCPLHYSTFDLTTGRKVAGPACRSLRVQVLTEEAGPVGEPFDPVAERPHRAGGGMS
jgi:nitrite reductase (NADH) small subunit